MVTPKVSVIMPLYNAEPFVEKAISSILNQTFKNFELLVLDDNSTDNSVKVVSRFNDERLHLIRNEKNLGVGPTLNRGVEISRGTYLARMDADDLAHPERLTIQCRYLDQHPEISLVGTDIIRVDIQGKPMEGQFRNPHSWGKIKWHMYLNCCIAHPTIMMRKEFFDISGNYQLSFAEDYLLWLTAIRKGLKICNLPQTLLDYRIHSKSISASKFTQQINSCGEILREHVHATLGINLDLKSAGFNFLLADRPIPFREVLKLIPFYVSIVWGCLRDKETTLTDFLFIFRRTSGRLLKGLLRSVRFRTTEYNL